MYIRDPGYVLKNESVVLRLFEVYGYMFKGEDKELWNKRWVNGTEELPAIRIDDYKYGNNKHLLLTILHEVDKYMKVEKIEDYIKRRWGLKCYLLKSKRGECVDCIILAFFFQSETIRNKYFKPDGDYTDLGLEGKKIMQTVLDELSKMDQSAEVYTDYVIQ